MYGCKNTNYIFFQNTLNIIVICTLKLFCNSSWYCRLYFVTRETPLPLGGFYSTHNTSIIALGDISRVHTYVSKPFRILIHINIHGLDKTTKIHEKFVTAKAWEYLL